MDQKMSMTRILFWINDTFLELCELTLLLDQG